MLLVVAASAEVFAQTNTSPLEITVGQPLRAEDKNQLATVEGDVTFVGKNGRLLNLELSAGSGQILVTVTNDADNLTPLLLKSHIRVTGICVGVYSDVDGKMVCSLRGTMTNLTLLKLSDETWWRYLPRTIEFVEQLISTNSRERIVRLVGTIQNTERPSRVWFSDETGRILIKPNQSLSDMTGREIEMLATAKRADDKTNFRCIVFRPVPPLKSEATNAVDVTTVEQVRWLGLGKAQRGYVFKLRGIVTSVQPDGSGSLQDATGGILVRNLVSSNQVVVPGDYCEMEGVSAAGQLVPILDCNKLTVLGKGNFPEPLRPTWGKLDSGALDRQWVELQGVVSSVTNNTMMLTMKGGPMACVFSRDENLNSFLNHIVAVRGVMLCQFDSAGHVTARELDVPAEDCVSINALQPHSIQEVNRLVLYMPDEPSFRRVRVYGQIVHIGDGALYLMNNTNGFTVVPKATVQVGLGDIVQASGFLEVDNPADSPLRDVRGAEVHKIGSRSLPPAIKLAPENLLNSRYDSTLVQIQSRVVGMNFKNGDEVFELQIGARSFFAHLSTAGGKVRPIPAGSLVQVTGVYISDISGNASENGAGSFELLLNSPADIRVLESPSWWTSRRAIAVVISLAVVILFAVIWISLLHRQVEKRTAQLSAANQSLKKEITERQRAEDELVRTRTQHFVEQERSRIARDLHDDLGGSLTKVALLSELALKRRNDPVKANESVEAISKTARRAIKSLDETVWAVSPHNDTLPHLIGYIGQSAVEFLNAAGINGRVDLLDSVPPLPVSSIVRHNVFLAVKEILTNIVRHADASEVWLRTTVDKQKVAMTIEDNGHGFAQSPDNAFADGLRNLRQRMMEIGGECDIKSAPGTGTRISLIFPPVNNGQS